MRVARAASGCFHSALCCPGFAATVQTADHARTCLLQALLSSFIHRRAASIRKHTKLVGTVLNPGFLTGRSVLGLGETGEGGVVNTVSPKQGLSILPGKETFHSGLVPVPMSGSLASARKHWESWQGAAHMLGRQNWQGPEKVLMKPICFTQEEGRG